MGSELLFVGLAYSLAAIGICLYLLKEAKEKRSEWMFGWALVFLIVSWSGIEWGLWNIGLDLFKMVFYPIVPLAGYFVAWSAFVIWYAETYFKRRDWLIFLAVIFTIILIASVCMNCIGPLFPGTGLS